MVDVVDFGMEAVMEMATSLIPKKNVKVFVLHPKGQVSALKKKKNEESVFSYFKTLV